jgi:hypothetical protein
MCYPEMEFSNDICEIAEDYGNFPDSLRLNAHGYFHRRDPDHIISVYLGTNCGMYYAAQCVTPGCPNRGWSDERCIHLPELTCDSVPGNIVKELLSKGFKYQMVYAGDGSCTYGRELCVKK